MEPIKRAVATIPLMGDDMPYFDLVTKDPSSFDDWAVEDEGQLAVDVVENPHDVIVRAAIAGVRGEDLSIHVTHDTLTIRGKRELCEEYPFGKMHVEECHWGGFSRTIILPHDVLVDEVVATLKNGVLNIALPKTNSESDVTVLDVT